MKAYFYLSFMVLLNSCHSIEAQKLKVKRIQYASFKPLDSVNSKSTEIFLYADINETGFINIKNWNANRGTVLYYTYQLNDSEIEVFNSILYKEMPLKKYMIKDKLDKNDIYASEYDFISIDYYDNYIDKLCFVMPYMSEEFGKFYSLIDDIFYNKAKKNKQKPFKVAAEFEKLVFDCYVQSNYLPKIETIPSFNK